MRFMQELPKAAKHLTWYAAIAAFGSSYSSFIYSAIPIHGLNPQAEIKSAHYPAGQREPR